MPAQMWVTPEACVTTYPSENAYVRRIRSDDTFGSASAAALPIPRRTEVTSGSSRHSVSRVVPRQRRCSFSRFSGTSPTSTATIRYRGSLSIHQTCQDASASGRTLQRFRTQVSLLRSGLYRAVEAAGERGITYTDLAEKVFESLGLPLAEYAENPDARRAAKDEITELCAKSLRIGSTGIFGPDGE